MKRVLFLLGIVLMTMRGLAGDADRYVKAMSEERLAMIERNLVSVLRSSNPCLVAGAAQVVRDLKRLRPEQSFSELVIPLMAIVKNEGNHCSGRVIAALALHDLKSSRGDFAISRMAEFTDVPLLKHVSLWLTYERIKESRNNVAEVTESSLYGADH